MERELFGAKTPRNQIQRDDRFIKSRSSLAEYQKIRRPFISNETAGGPDLWSKKYLMQKKNYMFMDANLGISAPKYTSAKTNTDYLQVWPCVPRKKSFLAPADSVLDLPRYRLAYFPDILDWSKDDILVAALDSVYYKWSWTSQALVSKSTTHNPIYCCKFDPRGELIALGTDYVTLEIHNNANKCVAVCVCKCALGNDKCAITAVEWSPTGNSLVMGCSRGYVTGLCRHGTARSRIRAYRNTILSLKISPDARYIVVLALMMNNVKVYMWPSFVYYNTIVIKQDFMASSIAWHPWRSALLGVSAVDLNLSQQSTINLWDAHRGKTRKVVNSPGRYHIDNMDFSHLTGEIVLSVWNSKIDASDPGTYRSQPTSCLLVLSDPENVVDRWGESHALSRVRTMVLSPDGTKLATATVDEDLIIWNFLPEGEKKKSRKRRFSDLPTYLDFTTFGISIR